MKKKTNKKEEEVRKYFAQQSTKFVKDLLDFCKEKQIDPIIIAEVLNITTQGFLVALVAGEKGLTKKDFEKLLEKNSMEKFELLKILDGIMKLEKKKDEVSYRS